MTNSGPCASREECIATSGGQVSDSLWSKEATVYRGVDAASDKLSLLREEKKKTTGKRALGPKRSS